MVRVDIAELGISLLLYGRLPSLTSFPILRLLFIIVNCLLKSSKIGFLEAGSARSST